MKRDIYMERNGRSEYTKEDIAKALAELNSCEGGDIHGQGYAVTYFIHLDDEGNILENLEGEEICFIRTIYCEEYGVDEAEWGDIWDSTYLSNHETLDCKAFANAVRDLTDEVNSFLKESEE